MKFARYCIFNMQYTKSEYEILAPQLISHMQDLGEWGEFFPMHISPFSYSESLAGEIYPHKNMQRVNTTKYSPSPL
jgi:hypothetical protein